MKLFLRYPYFILFILLSNILLGQEKEIYIQAQNTLWSEFVVKTESEYSVRFFYNQDSIPNIEIAVDKDSVNLWQLLNESFANKGIKISYDAKGNYFLFRNTLISSDINHIFANILEEEEVDEVEYVEPDDNYLKTYQNYIADNVVIGKVENRNGNKKVLIKGYVLNESDNSTIPQARLRIHESNTFITTNQDGYYEIIIKPGIYTLSVNSFGMHEKTYKLTVHSRGRLDIPLKTKSFLLEEAVVSANRNHNVRSTAMGFEKITAQAIKELPVVLGEPDIVKVALLLPGVQSVGELSSGFNVRGSPADQNMFYINNLPLYNSSHLYGLYTTFNADAIEAFEFYKGNIPVEFGGHLSSVFDIKAKKGDENNISIRGGIGPFASRILVEGPIGRDSISSFLISYRSTYSDWILKKIDDVDLQNSSASFYDGLINCTFGITTKDNIDVLLYGSNDESDLAFGIKNNYSNLGGTVKWTHIFGKKLVSELDIIKSRYYYNSETNEIEYLGTKNSFELNHNEVKLKFKYNFNNYQKFKFGLNAKLYNINYGDLLPLNESSSIKPIEFESEKAFTGSIFLSDNWDITDRLSIEGGIRATYYSYLGPKTVFKYEDNLPIELENIIDTSFFSKNEVITDNVSYDFRISGKYEISYNLSAKVSYNTLHQYIYMLSNTVAVSPTNKWKLSDSHLDPMRGQQFSLGLYKNFFQDKIEASAEVYYKLIENQVEYKDGADFLTNQFPETAVIQGDIKSYGLELMLRKKIGKLNGWINYTYSKAEVTVLNTETGEMNNQGNPYAANYDRPHAANLTLNYKLSKRVSFSTNVVYSTGRPITYPSSIYYHQGVQIIGVSDRNAYRLPDYFRTDLSIKIEGNLKKHKLAHSSFSIGIYNLTARKNVYSMAFQNEDGKIKAYKISILGTIIPSINFNLKFGNYED